MSSFSVSAGTISLEDLMVTEEEQNQLIALTMFLYKFIYRLGHLEMTTPQTLSVVNQAVAHFLTFPDPDIDDKLVIVAERLQEEPLPESPERRVRRLDVLGRLLRENPARAQFIELSDMSDDDDYDSDATTDQRESTAPSPSLATLGMPDDDATHRQRGGKKNKTNRILPQLKPVMMKNKKYTYKLNDPPSLRHKAIDEGIRYENKHMNKTKKQAAISKKGRFNILRIYRRNNNLKECKILTKDMEYMEKKYKLGKTSKICSKKKTKKSSRKKKSKRKTIKKK
jgi:hypothetical protein